MVIFPHFFKVADLVGTFLLDVSDDEAHLNDDRVIDDLVIEGVSLDGLIVGAFAGLAENAGAIFPTPEALGHFQNVGNELFEDSFNLSQRRVGVEVGMVIFGLDLEERGLFSVGLLNEVLEGEEGTENHFGEGVVHAAFPVVVVFFHFGGGTGGGRVDVLFD